MIDTPSPSARTSSDYSTALDIFTPGLERYLVPGRGSIVLTVAEGDHITLVNLEGQQQCELLFVDTSGRFDTSALGAKASSKAEGLKSILLESNESAVRTLRALARRNVDLKDAVAINVFGNTSIPGSSREFLVSRSGLIVLASPGEKMDFTKQNTATPIELRIKRNSICAAHDMPLPEPLADPLQDFRINAATAKAYIVQAGEYIQVIDVAGRHIALARVDATHAEIGTSVEIGKLDGQQKRLPARIVRFTHYDPDKTRPKA